MQVYGTNWVCAKFTPKEVELTAFNVVNSEGNHMWSVYSNYSEGGFDACSWSLNGTVASGRRKFSQNMCLSCDASKSTCDLVYADEQEYDKLPDPYQIASYGSSSKSNMECGVNLRTENYPGFTGAVANSDTVICGYGTTAIHSYDLVSAGAGCANGCNGINSRRAWWNYTTTYNNGWGAGNIGVCLQPKGIPIKGYSCVAVQ